MIATPSVPSPLPQARNSTLFYYQAHNLFPSVKCILNAPDIKDHLLSPLSRVVLQICFLYFCRISEVLNANSSDIIHPDRVVLHGLKRSNSYIIYLPGLSAQIAKLKAPCSSFPLFPISYTKLYRDAVRVGVHYLHKGLQNAKRLHAARYIFAKQVSNKITDKELAGLLRHRSLSSLSFYKS